MMSIAGGILIALAVIAVFAAALSALRYIWFVFWNVILQRPTSQEKAYRRMMNAKTEDEGRILAEMYHDKYGNIESL